MLSPKWSLLAVVFALWSCQPAVVPGDYPFDNSTLVALRPTAPADGATQAVVQLTVRDSTGAIVQDRQVEFVASGNVVLKQPLATDKLGQAMATLTSTSVHEETVGVRVRVGGSWNVLRQTEQVSFYDAMLIPENISLVLAQQGNATAVADGAQGVVFTLSVLDGMGQVVAGPL